MLTTPSIKSSVVLIFLLEIEITSPTKLLIKVDFPALVLPTRLIFNNFFFHLNILKPLLQRVSQLLLWMSP